MTEEFSRRRWQELAGLLKEQVDHDKVKKQADYIRSTPMLTPRAFNQALEDIREMLAGGEEDLRAKVYSDWSEEELQALLDELGSEREVSGKSIWGPDHKDLWEEY